MQELANTESSITRNRGAATPSTLSSSSENVFDNLLPSSLAEEEFHLALNKEATEEELEQAISRCRELVLECNNCSEERKWLVRHLVELRLRLEECKDAENDPQHPKNKSYRVSKRAIKGHHLKLQPLIVNIPSKYCDHCAGSIWSVVQTWYECEDCGYACHHKCLAEIIRPCAHVVVSERGTYEMEICPEEGLSAQKYSCAECGVLLPLTKEWTEARRCDYSGLYYCSICHWGSSAVVPARVIQNWDLSPQLVCQASLQQLRVTASQPLINLEKLNPKLFSLVHELSLVRRLRLELFGMKKYLSVCRNAIEDHLIWKHIGVLHLIDTPELYSLQDLVDTHSGELPSKLHDVIDIFTKHIKISCEVCKGRGHICEICSNDEVLFPFDHNAVVCKDCKSVLHKNCLSIKNNKCPKCIRLTQRKELALEEL